MKALILNSGLGHRMGVLTSDQPKCMTEISARETILSRQLRLLQEAGVREVILTTGYFDQILMDYCASLRTGLQFTFVKNPRYAETNYIYSIYCAREQLRGQELLLMHGDLVFEASVLEDLMATPYSCMKVSSTLALPEKDFKAVVQGGEVQSVGVNFFENAMEAQALYHLQPEDWDRWLGQICAMCEAGETSVYAEEALNRLAGACHVHALDVADRLCAEIDTPEDLQAVTAHLAEVESRTVYMCFSTDLLHSGHIALLRRARRLGRLIVGVLSDEAVAGYKRFPLMPQEERMALMRSLSLVDQVVLQRTLSYRENLLQYRPNYVVHGDDWVSGVQEPIRREVLQILETTGGQLVEFPYARHSVYEDLEKRARLELAMPDARRGRLRKLLSMKGLITVMEAHSGLTGLLVENAKVAEQGGYRQFDAMWISSLCDSTSRGKPDIELVDMTSRFRTVDEICEVTTKPIIFDGDTGGLTEHFVYTVRSLERMGVSMVIIEDKTGLKKNSLFGTEVAQTQDSIENFAAKIAAGKRAQRTADFMICARIESLILNRGMADALERAFAFVTAGADAIMIHSRQEDPAEIFEFVEKFRAQDAVTPLVVVPTSFHAVTEEEFKARGVNIVIYANQLTRSAFPAMAHTAETILRTHRALEADAQCMPFKEIITLIPEK